jgi:hypothetical protein
LTHQEWIELLKGKPARKNQYNARCPAHDDQHASLRISTSEPENVLVYWHAGCSIDEVVEALGKTNDDLFIGGQVPEKDRYITAEAVYH